MLPTPAAKSRLFSSPEWKKACAVLVVSAMAYCTRTRFLGTYIICQKPVDEASNDDVVDLVPDDLVPDDNTNAPVDVTPGNNGGSGSGSKAPANTGKF